jgi:FKBP-type peptidyl-prolyl cis-trans isomerase
MTLAKLGGALVLAAAMTMVTTMGGNAADGDWASKQASFLVDNGKKAGWKTTPSGLQYTVLKPGDAKKPKPAPGSEVTVHYEGRLIDGKVFDSSYARNEPATFPLSGVIYGWQEGVPLMRVGEVFEFAIPAALGYGDRDLGDIPPNSALLFKVELLVARTPAP